MQKSKKGMSFMRIKGNKNTGLVIALIIVVLTIVAFRFIVKPGQPEVQKWYNAGGQLHRDDDKPATIWYKRFFGTVLSERWYQDGQLHRDDDKPAEIWYTDDGEVVYEVWWQNGEVIKEAGVKPHDANHPYP